MPERSLIRRACYRLAILLLWPVLPLAVLVAAVIEADWREIGSDIAHGYRVWPKAWRKGGPV